MSAVSVGEMSPEWCAATNVTVGSRGLKGEVSARKGLGLSLSGTVNAV